MSALYFSVLEFLYLVLSYNFCFSTAVPNPFIHCEHTFFYFTGRSSHNNFEIPAYSHILVILGLDSMNWERAIFSSFFRYWVIWDYILDFVNAICGDSGLRCFDFQCFDRQLMWYGSNWKIFILDASQTSLEVLDLGWLFGVCPAHMWFRAQAEIGTESIRRLWDPLLTGILPNLSVADFALHPVLWSSSHKDCAFVLDSGLFPWPAWCRLRALLRLDAIEMESFLSLVHDWLPSRACLFWLVLQGLQPAVSFF